MITNCARPNEWIETSFGYISFDGLQLSVRDKNNNEIAYVSKVSFYHLPKEIEKHLAERRQ